MLKAYINDLTVRQAFHHLFNANVRLKSFVLKMGCPMGSRKDSAGWRAARRKPATRMSKGNYRSLPLPVLAQKCRKTSSPSRGMSGRFSGDPQKDVAAHPTPVVYWMGQVRPLKMTLTRTRTGNILRGLRASFSTFLVDVPCPIVPVLSFAG